METFSFLWWMAFLVCAGVVAIWFWAKALHDNIVGLQQELHKVLSKTIFMRIENRDNVIFAYNALTQAFICQGNNMEELNKMFGLRFPLHKGIIVEPDKELTQ